MMDDNIINKIIPIVIAGLILKYIEDKVVLPSQPPVAMATQQEKPANREASNEDYPVGFSCVPPARQKIPHMYLGESDTSETLQTDGKMEIKVTEYRREKDPKSGEFRIYPVIQASWPGQTKFVYYGFSRACDIQNLCAPKQG